MVESHGQGSADRLGGQAPYSLLLRSVVDLREVWLPLLGAASVRSVTLLGTEHGSTTSLVVELLRAGGGGRLLIVDPEPGRVPAAGRGLDIDVVRSHGAVGLDGHTPTDAYLIDGDANYATVSASLAAVDDAVHEFGRTTFPLVIVHDVGWPTGRRDQYRAPDRLTDADLQPHSWDAGVTLDVSDAIPGRGIRGDGTYAWAIAEGGPRNGVRTAVEEFVAGHPELRFFTVAPVLGLGIVVDRRAPFATRVAELLAPWVANPLLARLERNRLELYLRIVAMRDEAIAAARLHQQEWLRLDTERIQLVALDIEKSDRIAQLERQLVEERAAAADLIGAKLEESRLVAAARAADSRLRARLRRGPSRYEKTRARLAEEERRRREQVVNPQDAGLEGAAGALEAGGGDRLALPSGTATADGDAAGRGTGADVGSTAVGSAAVGSAGREEHTLWTPGWGAGHSPRLVPPRPNVPPPGEWPAPLVPPGAGSGAVLLTPGAVPVTPPDAGSSAVSNGAVQSSAGRPFAGQAAVGHPTITDTAGLAQASQPLFATSPGEGHPGLAPSGPILPVTPIQPGQPIPAGQPIPPGAAVHPAEPDRPAELGAPGQPPLFDRSGVPRRRRLSGAFAADRHEPRHRASSRHHNPDRNHNPDRPT